jgi:molybdenum cofactor cytidylyltransferase
MSSEKVVIPNIGIIILAAGASSRMGTPKQLLLHRGRSFLSYIVEVAIASMCQPDSGCTWSKC